VTISLLEHRRVSLFHADATELARELRARREVVNLITADTPYSERTHTGHDSTRPGGRSSIPYAFWTPEDVHVFVDTWREVHRGWLVSITDHVLWPAWQRAAERAGYYAGFPPIPLVVTGSRVRLRGDGPSPWSYFILVARPAELSSWGTIGRGAYMGPREKLLMTGGKPLWAMRQIVEDYSRPGDVVCDPVCGAATAGVAALFEGRDAVVGDGSLRPLGFAEPRLSRVLSYLEERKATRVHSGEQVPGEGETLRDDEDDVIADVT